MSLAARRAAAATAEAACVQARTGAAAALQQLRDQALRSATPARIVVSGLALGFVAGRRAAPAAGAGARVLGGPLFELATQTLLPGVLAGITAWSESLMAGTAAHAGEEPGADPTDAATGATAAGTGGDEATPAGDAHGRR